MSKIKNTFKNFLYSSLIAGSLLSLNNADAQRKIKTVDPLTLSPLQNYYNILTTTYGSDTLITDVNGEVTLDTTPPSLNVNVIAVNDTIPVHIEITATDDNGIRNKKFYLNNQLKASCTNCDTLTLDTLLSTGVYGWYSTSEDSSIFSNMRRVPSTAMNTFTVQGTAIEKYLNVKQGWNLISLPVTPSNNSKNNLFPSSVSNAYSYSPSTGYLQDDSLDNFIGYWLKFSDDEQVSISGLPLTNNQVDVEEGWNLLGTIDEDVLAGDVTSSPGGIIVSKFYGYNAGYFDAETLRAGGAYWAKASQAGSLTLNTSLEGILANTAFATGVLEGGVGTAGSNDERPPNPPGEQNIKQKLKALSVVKNGNKLLFNYDLDNSSILIYDILGRLVNKVENKEWNLDNFNNEKIANGVYGFLVTNNNGVQYRGLLNKLDGEIFVGSNVLRDVNSDIDGEYLKHKSAFEDVINKFERTGNIKGGVGTFGSNNAVPVTVKVKDELDTSKGAYFDFEETYNSVNDIPNKVALFPGDSLLGASNPNFSSLKDMLAYITYADNSYPTTIGTYVLAHYLEDQPIKIFIDSLSAPQPFFITDVRSAMQDWEDSTSFLYKGTLLNKADLFTEFTSNPDTGARHVFDDDHAYTIINSFYPQPFTTTPPNRGSVKRATIHYDTTQVKGFVRVLARHEIYRLLHNPNDAFRDDPDVFDPLSVPYNGRLVHLRIALQNFFTKGLVKMGVYKDD